MLQNKTRLAYYDYLRVAAIFGVIMIHVSAQNWQNSNVNSIEWQFFNIYDSMMRWAVPVFVMISGSLFLNREYNIKTIYKKNIFRLITAFFFWSIIYAVLGKQQVLFNAIRGHYHMWFIPMIIGLYMCIPIIHKIIESKDIAKYFMFLSFIVTFMLPQIVRMSNDFGGEFLKVIISAFNVDYSNMNLFLVQGYTFYFMLGYFLNQIEFNKKCRYIIYILGVFGVVVTILLDSFMSLKLQTPFGYYYGYFCINVLFESIAIFVWFRYNLVQCKKLINSIFYKLSKYSFGAYLVHILVMDKLNEYIGLNSLSFHPLISVPIIAIIVFIISFFISMCINHIPVLNRYIV